MIDNTLTFVVWFLFGVIGLGIAAFIASVLMRIADEIALNRYQRDLEEFKRSRDGCGCGK